MSKSPQRRAFEQLIRKLLRYPNSPASVVVHNCVPKMANFWETPEDEIDAIAMYYRLPSVSFRNSFHAAITQGVPGFRAADLSTDGVHPNSVGSQYLAYIIIYYLEAVLGSMPWLSFSVPSTLPPPMFTNNHDKHTFCKRNDQLKEAAVQAVNWA